MLLESIAIPANKTSSGRPKAPNPFVDNADMWAAIQALPVDAAPGTEGAALAVNVPGILDIKANKEFGTVSRQIRDAGYQREPKVTMRQIHTQVVGADGKPAVRIAFYAVTFIERKTKAVKNAENAENAETATDTETESAPASEAPAETPAAKSGRTRSGK
jgi:hypothetical protein